MSIWKTKKSLDGGTFNQIDQYFIDTKRLKDEKTNIDLVHFMVKMTMQQEVPQSQDKKGKKTIRAVQKEK